MRRVDWRVGGRGSITARVMSRPGGRWPLVAALAAVYTIWSSTYLALRVVVAHLPPFLTAGGRYVMAGAMLATLLRALGTPLPSRRAWLGALPVGALLFVVGNGFVASAEKTASSGAAALACALTPLWGSVFGHLFGQRVQRREWVGVALGMAGVGLLAASDARGTPGAMVLLVLAPIGWAFGSVLSRRLPQAEGMMAAAAQMITGGALMLLVGAGLGERLPDSAPASAWGAFAYLVVFGSLVGFSAYSYLLRTARPAVAMSYAYVNPAIAVLLGAALASETLGALTLGSMLLVVAGVAVLLLPAGRR